MPPLRRSLGWESERIAPHGDVLDPLRYRRLLLPSNKPHEG